MRTRSIWNWLLFVACLVGCACHPTLLITSADSSEGIVITRSALALRRSYNVSIVAGVDNLTSQNARVLRKAGADLRQVDSSSLVSKEAFANIQVAFFLPPLTDDRVQRTARLVKAAVLAEVASGILLSVMGADQNISSLAGYEACDDQIQRAWPTTHAILRTAFYVQNLLLWAADVTRRQTLRLPLSSDARTAPLYETDVAEVALAITDRSKDSVISGTFNLTGPAAMTGDELAHRLSLAVGYTVTFASVSKQEILDLLASSAPSLSNSERSLLADLASVQADTASHVMENLTHKSATSVDTFFSENKEAFQPKQLVLFF